MQALEVIGKHLYIIDMGKLFKFLVFVAVVVALFSYAQSKFDFLNISITDNSKESVEEDMEEEKGDESDNESDNYVELFVEGGNVIRVNVDLAQTDAEKSAGLSNRQYLGDYDGMWFIFDKDSNGPFWMKDMLIPLDIIFVDASGFIVDIKPNNPPCDDTQCSIVVSSSSYRYVLEVNSNFCEENGVKVGQSIKANVKSNI